MTLLRPPHEHSVDRLLESEQHVDTPALGFTFYWHSRHDQHPSAPGRLHCRLCRTSRKAGHWTSSYRPYSCLAAVAALATGAGGAQVLRGVREAGEPYRPDQLVFQEVFAGTARLTRAWSEQGVAQDPIEVFREPHLKRGYQPEQDLLRPEVQDRVKGAATEGPANVWWLAAPCTTFCDWGLENGGTRTFDHTEGTGCGP